MKSKLLSLELGFLYDVQIIKQTIREPQDLKLSSCADIWQGQGEKKLKMVF